MLCSVIKHLGNRESTQEAYIRFVLGPLPASLITEQSIVEVFC